MTPRCLRNVSDWLAAAAQSDYAVNLIGTRFPSPSTPHLSSSTRPPVSINPLISFSSGKKPLNPPLSPSLPLSSHTQVSTRPRAELNHGNLLLGSTTIPTNSASAHAIISNRSMDRLRVTITHHLPRPRQHAHHPPRRGRFARAQAKLQAAQRAPEARQPAPTRSALERQRRQSSAPALGEWCVSLPSLEAHD